MATSVQTGGAMTFAPPAAPPVPPAAASPQAAPPAQFEMKSVGKHTAVYGLGILLNRLVGFLMLPVYTRFLSPADYGVMELISMTLDVISIFAGAQLALGIFRYYHKTDDADEKRAVVSTAFAGLGLSYGLMSVGTWVFATSLSQLIFKTPEHASLLRIASIGLAFTSLMNVPLSYARVLDRSRLFVVANLAKLLIGLALNIVLLVGFKMGVKGVMISNAVASALVGTWLSVWTLRKVGFHFTRAATRDLVRYGLPLMGTWMATFTATYGDRYFLQAEGTPTDVGLYSLAYTFGFLLAAVGYIPFMQVWEPKRFEIAKRGADRDELLARGFVYLNLLLLTTAVGISLFVGDVLRVMTTPAFYSAAEIVPIILLAYVLQGWTSLQDIGILVRERTEFVTIANWLAAGVALLFYWLLIPRFLGWGAAVATLIAFTVRHIAIYAFSQRLWPVRYQWAPVVRLAAVALAVGGVGYVLPPMALWASLAARTALLAAYVVALWTMDVLAPDDRVIARRVTRAAWARVAGRFVARQEA